MTYKNRYIKCEKISEAKFRVLLKHFSHDLDAITVASLVHLNRKTVNRYLNHIRKRKYSLIAPKLHYKALSAVAFIL